MDDVPVGDYYLQEIKASEGYALNNEKIHFTVEKLDHRVGTLLSMRRTKPGQKYIFLKVPQPVTKVEVFVIRNGEQISLDPIDLNLFNTGEADEFQRVLLKKDGYPFTLNKRDRVRIVAQTAGFKEGRLNSRLK